MPRVVMTASRPTAPRIRRLRPVGPAGQQNRGRQLRVYGELNTRVSSILPRPSSDLYRHRLTHRTGRPGARADRTSFTTSCRGQFWGSRNHADISGSGGEVLQKLVQFARPNAFCKNSCAQRPHLTPRTGPGPGSPRAPRTTSRGASQSGVPGARRRVHHGGRPGARRDTPGAPCGPRPRPGGG